MNDATNEIEQVNQEVQTDLVDNQVSEIDEQEESAGKYGWVPKEKYRGDPKDWVDAKTFNEKFVPAIQASRQTNKELREELERVKRVQQESIEILKKSQADALERKDAELKDALSILKQKHREAIRNGDDQEADDLEVKIETLNSAVQTNATERVRIKEKSGTETQEKNPVLEQWVDENTWFAQDADLRDYALHLGNKWKAEGTNPGGRDLLDKLTAEIKRVFPHKFENQNRTRPSTVEGGRTSGFVKGKSASDLPPEHRKIMKEMVADGLLTEQEYVNNYFNR